MKCFRQSNIMLKLVLNDNVFITEIEYKIGFLYQRITHFSEYCFSPEWFYCKKQSSLKFSSIKGDLAYVNLIHDKIK